MSDATTEFAYIGRLACGCVVAAIVDCDSTKNDIGDTIKEWLDDGLTIERVTVAWVQQHGFDDCTHEVQP